RGALIHRLGQKFADRNRLAYELQDLIPKANGLFLKMLELNRAIDAAWGWPAADRLALMLPRETIFGAIEHELFRVTAVPLRGGGQDEGPNGGHRFPGSRPPNLGVMNLPSAVTSLADTMREAGDYGSRIMRSGKGGPTPVAPEPTPPATNGDDRGYPLSNGNAAPASSPQRSAAEERLSALLRKQSDLASLPTMSPDQDREYGELVSAIAMASAQVEAEKTQ